MAYVGSDFGFVGGAYEAPNYHQDQQRLINWYVELDPTDAAKTPTALLATPGLEAIIDTGTGAVRGLWVLPNGTRALVVTGNTVVMLTQTHAATNTTAATFSQRVIGTLRTSTGPVCMRDNGELFGGAGGYAVIVDGAYGYLVRLAGAGTATTQVSTTLGSNSVSFVDTPNYQFIVGAVVSDSAGYLPAGTTITYVDYNLFTLTLSAGATATTSSDTLTAHLAEFQQITDPAFLPASRVAFIEGWLIFSEPNTRTFFTNAPVPYTVTFAGSFYALKDSSSDNLVTLIENQRELWLIGERTSEVWYDAGNANFAFSRLPGVGPQVGCSARDSIARLANTVLWLSKNEQGENIVVSIEGYQVTRVSTHAIEKAISGYAVVSDAIGYGYQEQGHPFYVLTFPSADATWVFDLASKLWHVWATWEPTSATYFRHRSNCYMNFCDLRVAGDYQNGTLYNMTRKVFTDNGALIRRERRTPHVWLKSNRARLFQSSLQIEFTPGTGAQTGQGQSPQAMLRWSNDSGANFGNEHWCSIGAAGVTLNRCIWRRLGRARDRVYELTYSEPTQADIVGATLYAESEFQEA
jgi:hypothetical protein